MLRKRGIIEIKPKLAYVDVGRGQGQCRDRSRGRSHDHGHGVFKLYGEILCSDHFFMFCVFHYGT